MAVTDDSGLDVQISMHGLGNRKSGQESDCCYRHGTLIEAAVMHKERNNGIDKATAESLGSAVALSTI